MAMDDFKELLSVPDEMAVLGIAVADVQHLAAGAIERWWDDAEREMEDVAEVIAQLGQMAKSEQAEGRLPHALYFACETTSLYRRVSDADPDNHLVVHCRPIYLDMTSTMVDLKQKMANGDFED
jgi:hypothetical protein